MMRFIIAFILSLVSIASFAQTQQTLGAPGTRIATKGDMSVDSIFYLPRTLVTSRAPSQAGALRYQASDSTLYQWTGTAWRRITSNVDTLLITTRAWRQKGDDSLGSLIAVKLNISDTSSMLSPYLRKSDTTSMLTPYVRIAGFGLIKGTQTLSVDSASIATRARVQKAVDSLGGLITAGGAGTVTSVSAGTGMSFTTITTTGSVSADTVALSTRAWRQKGIDSLAASEVSISDTATMLNPYTRGSGIIGYIPKWSATRSIDTSQIFQVADRIGIGTTTVNSLARMQINGNLHFDHSDGREIRSNGTGTFRINNPADAGIVELNTGTTSGYSSKINIQGGFVNSGGAGSNIITFTTASNERMRLTAAGRLLVGTTTEGTNTVDIAGTLRSTQGANFATTSGSVGIGTTTTLGTLDVVTNSSNYGIVIKGRSSDNRSQLTFASNNGGSEYAYIDATATGSTTFGTNVNTPLRFITNATERIRIANTGEVGIGTTSPASILHVSSDASNIRKSNAAGTTYTELTNDGLIATGTSLTLFAPTSQSLILSSGNGEAARFNANKRLLVNTTTDAGYLVDVNGTLRTVNGANFATTSGEILMGMADAGDYKVQMGGATYFMSGVNTALTTAAGLHYMAKVDNTYFTGFNFQGVASSDMFFGRTASSDDLVISTSNTGSPAERVRFAQAGNVGIGTGASPSERLDVNGRIRARTIDSTSSPINMLTSDVNGVIRKAAVPSGGGGTVTSVSAGTGMSFTTITTTGSVAVDTLSIATRARLYKTIDSMKAVGDVNVYNSNGTLTGNRVISKNGSNLTLSGDVGEFRVENAAGTNRVAVTNDGIVATGTSLTLFAPSAQSLILSSGNGEAGRFNADKEFLIGTSIDAGDYKLQVNGNGYVSGRMNIGSVDSFSTAQNILFVDNDGRIKKAAVPAGGVGGVTSVATGFGIDGGTITSTGTLTADTVEMATRARVQKGIDSVAALARVTGSGTTNYVPLFTGSTALGNSSIYEASSEVLIGTTSDAGAFKLQVNGVAYASDGLRTTAPSGGTAHTWKLGSVVADSVALDPNNYLEVEVNGVFYRIALITLL